MKFTSILFASLTTIRHSCAMYMAPDFLHNKGNHIRFTKTLVYDKYLSIVPWCFLLSFIAWLSSWNRLQKGEKFAYWCLKACRKGVNKLFTSCKASCLHISIIINVPAVAFSYVVVWAVNFWYVHYSLSKWSCSIPSPLHTC